MEDQLQLFFFFKPGHPLSGGKSHPYDKEGERENGEPLVMLIFLVGVQLASRPSEEENKKVEEEK